MQISRRRPRSGGSTTRRKTSTSSSRNSYSRLGCRPHIAPSGHAFEVLNLYTGTALDKESMKAFSHVTAPTKPTTTTKRKSAGMRVGNKRRSTSTQSSKRKQVPTHKQRSSLHQDPYRIVFHDDYSHIDNVSGVEYSDMFADQEAYLAATEIQKVFRGHLHRRKARFIKSLWTDMDVVLHDTPGSNSYSPGAGKFKVSVPVVHTTKPKRKAPSRPKNRKSPSRTQQLSPSLSRTSSMGNISTTSSKKSRSTKYREKPQLSPFNCSDDNNSMADSVSQGPSTARTMPNLSQTKLRKKVKKTPTKPAVKKLKSYKTLQRRIISKATSEKVEDVSFKQQSNSGDQQIPSNSVNNVTPSSKGTSSVEAIGTQNSFVDKRITEIDEKIQKLSEISTKIESQLEKHAQVILSPPATNVVREPVQTSQNSPMVPLLLTDKVITSGPSPSTARSKKSTSPKKVAKKKKALTGAKLAVRSLLASEFTSKLSKSKRPSTSRAYSSKGNLTSSSVVQTDFTPRSQQMNLRIVALEAKLEKHMHATCVNDKHTDLSPRTTRKTRPASACPSTAKSRTTTEKKKHPQSARIHASQQDPECNVNLLKRTASAKNASEYTDCRPIKQSHSKGNRNTKQNQTAIPEQQVLIDEDEQQVLIDEDEQQVLNDEDCCVGDHVESVEELEVCYETKVNEEQDGLWAFPTKFQQCPDLESLILDLDKLNDHLLHHFGEVEEVPLETSSIADGNPHLQHKTISTTSTILLRKQLEDELEEYHREKERNKATTSIQRHLRGHRTRAEQQHKVNSTVVIQRVYRGYQGRRRVAPPRAARKIQKVFRGRAGRNVAKKETAARAIQRKYRNHTWERYYAEQRAWDSAYRAADECEESNVQDDRVEEQEWTTPEDPKALTQGQVATSVQVTKTYSSSQLNNNEQEYVEVTETINYIPDSNQEVQQDWNDDGQQNEYEEYNQDVTIQEGDEEAPMTYTNQTFIQDKIDANYQSGESGQIQNPRDEPQAELLEKEQARVQGELQHAHQIQAAAQADTIAAALAAANAAVEALRAATAAAETTARSHNGTAYYPHQTPSTYTTMQQPQIMSQGNAMFRAPSAYRGTGQEPSFADSASVSAAFASMEAAEAIEQAEAASVVAEHARAEEQAQAYREMMEKRGNGRRQSLMDKTESKKAEYFFELALSPNKKQDSEFFALPEDERPQIDPQIALKALQRGQSELPTNINFHSNRPAPVDQQDEWDHEAYQEYYGPWAATAIQRVYRGHRTRDTVYRPHVSARAIQRAYRLHAWVKYNQQNKAIPLTPSNGMQQGSFWGNETEPKATKHRRASQDYLNMLDDFWKSPNSNNSSSPNKSTEVEHVEGPKKLNSARDTPDKIKTPLGKLNAPRISHISTVLEHEEQDATEFTGTKKGSVTRLPSRLDYVDLAASATPREESNLPVGMPSIDATKAQFMKLQTQDSLFNVPATFPEMDYPDPNMIVEGQTEAVDEPIEGVAESIEAATEPIEAATEPIEAAAEPIEANPYQSAQQEPTTINYEHQDENTRESITQARPSVVSSITDEGYQCVTMLTEDVLRTLIGYPVRVVRSNGTADECVLMDLIGTEKVRCKRVANGQVFVKKKRFCWYKL